MSNQNEMPVFEQVGRGFTGQWYQHIAGDRNQLAGVYRNESLVTWCNDKFQGIDQIMTKLTQGLQFGRSQWKAEEVDCQPVNGPGPQVLVTIQGQVRIEGENHALRFNDVQFLKQDQQGWHISNQIFRILGGAEG
jgi:hypothetical protein